jgi:uncharacterized protein YbaP (TraB family)
MKKIALLLLIGFLTLTTSGQTKNVLYKVEKAGYQTSYLFGTIHMLPADKVAFTDGCISALNEAQVLILEADIGQESVTAELLISARLPNGGTLDTALSPEDYALLDSALMATSGMGMKAYKYFKPFFLDAALMMSIAPDQFEIMENVLADLYKTDTSKTIAYLETVTQQMSTFDSIPIREQLGFTMEYLRQPGGMQAEYDSLVATYVRADLEKMYALSIAPYAGTRYDYFLLDKRNKAWMPKLLQSMKQEVTFIAVGAGHLAGPVGLISLFKAEGFTVTPVKN